RRGHEGGGRAPGPGRSGRRGRVLRPVRPEGAGHARAVASAQAPGRDRPLSLPAQPDVRRPALPDRRPGRAPREGRPPRLRRRGLGGRHAVRPPLRGARPARALRRGVRGLLRGRAPLDPPPAALEPSGVKLSLAALSLAAALVTLLSPLILMPLFARVGGWTELAEGYPSDGEGPRRRMWLGHAVFRGWVGYNGALIVASDARGLFLSTL